MIEGEGSPSAVSLFGYDIDDDRCSEKRCGGIQWNDTGIAWKHTDDVADKSNDRTCKYGGRHKHLMIVGDEQHSGNMGNSQSDERDRTAKCGGNGRQQTGQEEQVISHPSCVDAQILGIFVAEQHGIERFNEHERESERYQSDECKNGHLLHGNPAEIAQAPYHITLHSLFSREEIEQGDGRRSHITNHDAHDEQHDVVFDHSGKQQNDSHDQHGSCESRHQDSDEACERIVTKGDAASQQQHDKSHAKRRTAIDAEDAWSG